MSDKDQGSFLTGFSLGLFAGAVGYFLFGTDKGKSFREDISQEWDEAKEKMVQEGVIENKDANLRDVINDLVSKVLGSQRAEELIPTKKNQKPPLDSARGRKAKSDSEKDKNPSQSGSGHKSKNSSKKFKGT